MNALGYEALIGTLLPGSLVLLSVWLLVARFARGTALHSWLAVVGGSEWLFSVVILLGSALCGAILGSFLEMLEWRVMDPREAKRQGIKSELYDEEWYCYVESLDQGRNSYISRKAMSLFFEVRAGSALLLLGVAYALWAGSSGIAVSILLLFVGLILLFAADQTHGLLAFWRHRRFETIARANLERTGQIGEESWGDDTSSGNEEGH